jgi:hypothetical protein
MIKPDIVYDNEKQEFRQFGTTEGKTLLPIYIVGILLAIILYIFFHYLSNNYNCKGEEEFTSNNKSSNIHNKTRKKATIILDSDNCDNKSLINKLNDNYYCLQQQQIQQLQNQMNQLVQYQIQQLQQQKNEPKSDNANTINDTKFSVPITNKAILPNNLSI